MRKCLLQLMLLFLLPLSAEAAVFTGRMMTPDSTAFAYATVFIPELKQGAMTDAEGKWNLPDVPDGTYRVEYSYMGYESQSEEITLSANAPVHREIYLRENAIRLAEVVFINGGVNPAIAILRKVAETNKGMKKRIESLQVRESMAGDYDLRGVPSVFWKMLKIILLVKPSYRRLVVALQNHPLLKLNMYIDITASGKKEKATDPVITYASEEITKKEAESMVKVCGTESIYDLLEELNESFDTDKKAAEFNLVGTYEKDGKVIDILTHPYKPRYKKNATHADSIKAEKRAARYTREMHVVEGDWAVYCIRTRSLSFISAELAPHTWLPVSILKTFNMGEVASEEGLDKEMEQKIDSIKTLREKPDLPKKKQKEIDKLLKDAEMAKGLLTLRVETASSFKYGEVKVK